MASSKNPLFIENNDNFVDDLKLLLANNMLILGALQQLLIDNYVNIETGLIDLDIACFQQGVVNDLDTVKNDMHHLLEQINAQSRTVESMANSINSLRGIVR